MTDHLFHVTNDQDVTFHVRIVREGDKWGRDDCLTWDDERPAVEFYDATADPAKFGPRGQFVSHYFLETILEGHPDFGIDLHHGVIRWSITGRNKQQVIEWATRQLELCHCGDQPVARIVTTYGVEFADRGGRQGDLLCELHRQQAEHYGYGTKFLD